MSVPITAPSPVAAIAGLWVIFGIPLVEEQYRVTIMEHRTRLGVNTEAFGLELELSTYIAIVQFEDS